MPRDDSPRPPRFIAALGRAGSSPLVLWICAAVCAHTGLGKGTKEYADQYNDSIQLTQMVDDVRRYVFDEECKRNPKLPGCPTPMEVDFQTIEVAEVESKPEAQQERDTTSPEDDPADPTKKDAPKPPEAEKQKPLKIELPKVPPPPPPPPPPAAVAKKDEPKPPELKVAVVPKQQEKAAQLPPPPLQQDKRIAVKQQVDPNQKDNPTAKFLGNEANHVKDETVATQTNTEKDDKNPTPGGNHTGPTQQPGDADRTKIRQDEDRKGAQNVAPGDRGQQTDITKPSNPPPPRNITASTQPAQPTPKPATNPDNRPRGTGPAPAQPPQPQERIAAGGAPQTANPELVTSPNGNPTDGVAPARPANSGSGRTANVGPGTIVRPSPIPTAPVGGSGGAFGRGMPGFNLTQQQIAQTVVGQHAIDKLRVADGERRKSEHRGSWHASTLEKWRSAIENYVSSVKPGNQTALNTAASPFATYLNGMHNRIHPIFADHFLGSLGSLAPNHPMNDPKVMTRLEIVLTKEGLLKKMGVVKASGITAFDVAALDSVFRAQPFGPAPTAIVSPDGNVYLHWEFHRDEVYACSTMNARPFLLNAPPSTPPSDPPPPGKPPQGPQERGTPVPTNTRETREGALPIAREPTTT